MCLSRIDYDQTREMEKNPGKVVEAWKVFGVREGRLYPAYPGTHGKETPLPEEEWLMADASSWIFGNRGMRYRAGWHASVEDYARWLLGRRKANLKILGPQRITGRFDDFVVRKVLLRTVETVGRQDGRERFGQWKGYRTWVAQEMWICPGNPEGRLGGGRTVDIV